MWDSLWMATALLLVIEGIFPFLDPKGMRRSMLMIAELDDRTLRVIGLFSMLGGVALLYLVN
ncbi:MAG: DUF2065 domain-containing protein [Candidatus Polarisedimenticolaceae bacterium]|nr:DUF2065 domain-containing protein [Candidatus Polarisedimenticolaceae bacterium]